MKKLLITGANGFVGSYFVNKYKDKYNIQVFSFLKNDINNLDCSGIDAVFHLSALVHQIGRICKKEEYERVNVTQTLELARKAKKSGVKLFIFMSTVKVYGEETNNKYTKNSVCNPEDEYGKSKLKAELELKKLENESFKVSIIRTPIVYGYGVKANIKSLIKLVEKVSVLPFAHINNRRSIVYVGNLCYMCDEVIAQSKSGVFLVSDDEPLSTSKLIKLIAENLDKKVYLVKIPFFETILKLLKPSFHKRLYGSLEVDTSHTQKILNLKNPYTVDDGIKYMIKGESV